MTPSILLWKRCQRNVLLRLSDILFRPVGIMSVSRKRYEQEQLKLNGESLKRFKAKFPKTQVITKEQLGMYLTALAMRPHIVAKGKNFVIKEFNSIISEEFRKNKETFNEIYFKKCVCAAIIYRTTDNYLESNKDSAKRQTGFWYKGRRL